MAALMLVAVLGFWWTQGSGVAPLAAADANQAHVKQHDRDDD